MSEYRLTGKLSCQWLLLLSIWFFPFNSLTAQWSNDPSSNLILSQEGSPMSAKIIYSEGRYIFTYFKGINKNYCLHLQILDFDGRPKFGGDGLIISDHPQKTTTLSDLIVDKEGNILIAFSDTRNSSFSDIAIYKLDTAGNQLWGENGISLLKPNTNDAKPIIIVNPDNSITLGFNSFDKVIDEPLMEAVFYHFSENGTILWNGEPKIIKDQVFNVIPLGMMSLADGGIMIAYTLSIFEEPGMQVLIKRIDANGLDVWGKDLIVTNQCLYFSADVSTYSGPNGVLYVTWNTNGCYSSPSMIHIQGITQEGNTLWPQSGVQLTEDSTKNHYSPRIQGINSEGDILALWYSVISPPKSYNLMGQLIGPSGELKWGNNGIEIENKFGLSYVSSIVNDTAIIVYSDRVFDLDMYQVMKAVAINKYGSFCWPNPILLNDLRTAKALYGFTPISNSQGVVVFSEDKGILDKPRIVAQNLWTDGSIGLRTSWSDLEEYKSEIQVFYTPGVGIWISGITNPGNIMVYNMLGQCYHDEKFNTLERLLIETDDLHFTPGIYFVKVWQKGKKVTCSKIWIN
jgi:hypothetical protein